MTAYVVSYTFHGEARREEPTEDFTSAEAREQAVVADGIYENVRIEEVRCRYEIDRSEPAGCRLVEATHAD